MTDRIRLTGWAGCFLVAAACALIASGCAFIRRGANESAPTDELTLALALDKSSFRPGEAVLTTVTLTNNTRKPVELRELDAQCVRFFLASRQAADPPLERAAVFSAKEPTNTAAVLAPGGNWSRPFLLTRLTEFKGPMAVQAHYDPNPAAQSRRRTKVYSEPVQFEVAGETALRRNSQGLIVKEEAIALARERATGNVTGAEAVPIVDEAGFDRWWVNLNVEGRGQPLSFFVDPYRGRVWREAEPFSAEMARDKRFDRPANLPSRPARTGRR